MQPIAIEKAPLGVPVELCPEIRKAFRQNGQIVSSYATLRSFFPITNLNFIGQVSMDVLTQSGKIQRIPLYAPKGKSPWTVTPVEKGIGERLQRIREKNSLRNPIHHFTTSVTSSGADPEIFVIDGKTKKVIPAFVFLPDKKKAVRSSISESDSCITAFWDGFQAEFSMGSFGCMQVMSSTIKGGLNHILSAAKKVCPTAQLSADSVVELDPDLLMKVADHEAALGCSRSYNVYGTPPISIENPRMLPFRFAGGHMHFGDGDLARESEEKIQEYVKVLDVLSGVTSVLWFQGLENPIRRQFYGRAGEYRRPKHGLEYRTLGNAWLRHPALFHLVYGFARTSLMFARSGMGKYLDVNYDQVKEVIDTYDVKGAKEIVWKNKAIIRGLLKTYSRPESSKVAFDALETGLGVHMEAPDDISRNWLLTPKDKDRKDLIWEWGYAGPHIASGKKI